MDIRSFKLHLVDRHVRAIVADACGERARDLEGDAADRVAAAAAGLVAAVAAQVGGAAVRSVSVDVGERVLRASLGEGATAPAVRVDGAALDALARRIVPVARAIVAELMPRPPVPAGTTIDRAFWSWIWQVEKDGWELGRAAPPLVRWAAGHDLRGVRVLVPGCGRGHEARLCARAGATVTAIDYAPEAVAAARALIATDGLEVEVRQADLFDLPRDERWDLVVEHCCFCAIAPARRDDYVRAVADALAPGGRLVGLFWGHGRAGGPPFSVDADELGARFSRRFELGPIAVPTDSVGTRFGEEMLVEMTVRAPS